MNVGGREERQSPWWADRRVTFWSSLVPAAVALCICVQQLSINGALLGLDEYDDGVYLGGAIRLAHGSLPYKDFAFPHPPGIPLLFLPLALLGRIGSTRTLLGMVRVITAIVAAGNVWMVARLLRRRGVVPAVAASLGLAVFPLAVHANKTLLIEPYVVFFALLGLRLLLAGDPDAHGDDTAVRGRRLLVAGVVLGFAVVVKLWALLPIIGVLAACASGWRSRWRTLLGGLAVGAGVPSLPFFLASPGGFVHQVFVVQFERGKPWYSTSVSDRLVMTFGLRPLPEVVVARASAQLTLGLLLLTVGGAYVLRRYLGPLDRFAVVTAVVSVSAVLLSAEYFPHYAYFTAAFLALVAGAAVGALLEAASGALHRPSVRRWAALVPGALLVLVVVAGWVGYQKGRSLVTLYGDAVTVGDFGPDIAAAIPAGACTITDVSALTISAGRFVADGPCPAMVDPFYEWLVRDPKHVPPAPPPYDAGLVERWKEWMTRADFVVLSTEPFRMPWDQGLVDWFNARFEQVAEPGPRVFRRMTETSA